MAKSKPKPKSLVGGLFPLPSHPLAGPRRSVARTTTDSFGSAAKQASILNAANRKHPELADNPIPSAGSRSKRKKS